MPKTLITWLLAAAAVSASDVDKLIYSSELALQGRERAQACQFEEAISLTKQAIRETSLVQGATAAAFGARLQAQLLGHKRQKDLVKRTRFETLHLLSRGRVEQAATRWFGSGAEPCGSDIQAEIARQRLAAAKTRARTDRSCQICTTTAEIHSK